MYVHATTVSINPGFFYIKFWNTSLNDTVNDYLKKINEANKHNN